MSVELCGAKRKKGAGLCGKTKGWGTDHPGIGPCKLHGGNTRNHVKSARKQMAAIAVETYGLPREVDPHDALLEELHRTAGHVAWLGAEVRKLGHGSEIEEEKNGHGDLTGKVGLEGYTEGGAHHHPTFEPNVLVKLYAAERKHMGQIAKTCIEVGIEERRVRLAEQMGETIAILINGILGDLKLSPKQQKLAPKVVRNHLIAVSEEDEVVEAEVVA